MIIEGLVQNTPEWLVHRVGLCTGSRVADVIKRLTRKSGDRQAGDYAQCHYDYLWEVVIERLTGRAADSYVSPAMEWGIEHEAEARGVYEVRKDVMATPIGFAMHPTIEWFGASPDALVGEEGVLEIKCPNTSTHLAYLLGGEVPIEYVPQMMAEMACAERKWCDFVSYDPRLPHNLQFFCRRFHRNDELIAQMEAEVRTFLEDVILKMGELAERAAE
jgi:putative phage-type endonuclease